jgi:hypothetical protein
MKRIAKIPVGLSLKILNTADFAIDLIQVILAIFLFKSKLCRRGREIAPQKELKSKFKLQIITIFALKTIMNIKIFLKSNTDSGNFFLLAGPAQ